MSIPEMIVKSHDKAGPVSTVVRKAQAKNTEDVAARVTAAPGNAAILVRESPRVGPELMQYGLAKARPDLVASAVASMRQEFERTRGHGTTIDQMFIATLRLEGPGAEQVRAEMKALIAARDRANTSPQKQQFGLSDPSVDAKDAILALADADAAARQLYVNLHDNPRAAASQMAKEALNDNDKLNQHSEKLRWFLRDPKAAVSFVDAIVKLDGPGSTQAKLHVTRELMATLQTDVAMHRGLPNSMIDRGTASSYRTESLVPVLAQLISDPEVARDRAAVGSGLKAESVRDAPSTRDVLDVALRPDYTEETQSDVRYAISLGAGRMLDSAIRDQDAQRGQNMLRAAGSFLGTAAASQKAVGARPNAASHASDILTVMGEVPGGGAVASIAKQAGKLVGFFKEEDTDMNMYTNKDTGLMLRLAYSAKHPEPPKNTQERDAYDVEFQEWALGAQQEFQNAFTRESQRKKK